MIYFLLYLLVEILVSVEFASAIGGLYTFLEVILSALIGIALLGTFKETLLFNIAELMSGGITFSQFKSRNVFPFAGAVLLIIPGFFSDIVGILFQFSILTDFLKLGDTEKYKPNEDIRKKDYEDNIIDVEVIEKRD
jgi:UPF0716 family protein affecting phage T7 exclusion